MGVNSGGRALVTTMNSVLQQTEIPLEVVVVDDGSTDDAAETLANCAAADPRVRVIRQPSAGLTAALIRGCASAKGDLIARQDVADLSLPTRFARQVALLNSDPTLSFVSCWARAMGPCDEFLYEIQRPASAADASDLLVNRWTGPPHHGSVMFRKGAYESVGGYRREFYFSQDSDLWLRLGEIGRIAYVPECLYAFRITENGISSRYRRLQHRLGALAHECQQARLRGSSEAPLLARASELKPNSGSRRKGNDPAGAYFIGRCLLRQRDPRARSYLLRAARRRPWWLGAWLGLVQLRVLGTRSNNRE